MLFRLLVNNTGGIASAELSFKDSFVVVTGESGTGKSSLVRAVELLSGRRAQSDFIRYGADSAEITGVMSTQSDHKNKIEPLENETISVDRLIFRNGRSKSLINEKNCYLSFLRSFMSTRVNIQSQFAQLALLDPEKQLDLVDCCGGYELARLARDVSSFFRKAYEAEREARSLRSQRGELQEKYQQAEEVINIVDSIKPDIDAERKWNEEVSTLKNDIRINREKQSIIESLRGNENTSGIIDSLQELAPRFEELVYEEKDRNKARTLADELLDKCNDMIELMESTRSLHSLEELEQLMDETERRSGSIRKAKRLSRTETIEDLLNYVHDAKKALLWMRESSEKLSQLENKGRELRKRASEKAMDLRRMRKASARSLESRVNNELNDLAMDHLTFSINILEMDKLRENGADEVEFMLSNKEGFTGAVTKIASGGELSRLLLALQLSMPHEQLPETVVFDEVEAGLGGRAAVLAGYKLKQLSSRCQVILITHEASIAALADQHFIVHKDMENTLIYEPDRHERISELARMLSGDFSLEEARQHAEKLLTESSLSTVKKN